MVVSYSRASCPLSDHAQAAISRVMASYPAHLRAIIMDSSEEEEEEEEAEKEDNLTIAQKIELAKVKGAAKVVALAAVTPRRVFSRAVSRAMSEETAAAVLLQVRN